MLVWVRTNRRAPGEDRDALNPARVPGPWHVIHRHGLTWCGKRPLRLVASQRTAVTPPGDEARCQACLYQIVLGYPRS